MKSFAIAVIITALGASLAIATECVSTERDYRSWFVEAKGVPDIEGTCHQLWIKLQEQAGCKATGFPKFASCGEDQIGRLQWIFGVPKTCDGADVQAAWFWATGDKFGIIECHPR